MAVPSPFFSFFIAGAVASGFIDYPKENLMKLPVILSSLALLTACNSGPATSLPVSNRSVSDSLRFATDTTGLAEYQEWKAQNELGKPGDPAAGKTPAVVVSPSTGNSRTAHSTEGGAGASEPGHTNAKKGWSKTAKGAVIGGVAGAGTGAVVNKKNRAAGAVIGGVLGAGAGAVIGNEMDKKDGRH
jgi:hypothetical protein